MESIVQDILQKIPRTTVLVVDISNMRDSDLRDVFEKGQCVFISTHKNFNYRHHVSNVPTKGVPNGTVWVVLELPIENESGVYLPRYSARERVFSKDYTRKSPLRLKYYPKNACSIKHREKETRRAHMWCEVDDAVIALLCHRTGLPVATHDRKLREMVRTSARPRVPKVMNELMTHCRVSIFRMKNERWERRGRRQKRRT